MVVTRSGTLENRAGTTYATSVKTATAKVRLIRFASSVGQGLLLEFGALYVRFNKNGAAIMSPTPLGAYAGGTTYTHGQTATYGGRTYLSLAAANTGNQPDISPTWWYVQPTSGVLELPTPVAQASVATFQVAQINDLMYLTDQGFYPQVLTHYGDQDWTIANFVLSTGISAPTGLGVNAGTAGSNTQTYTVTTVSDTGAESLAATPASTVGGQPTNAHPNVITWNANPDAHTKSYNVYSIINGVPAFVGNSVTTSFSDGGIIASFAQQPPVAYTLFQTSSDYPAVVGSYQQRLIFANTVNQPQTAWGSAIGVFTSFTTALPVVDSGSFTFTIAGRTRQYIQAVVDIGKLVIFTSAGEYIAYGNQFGAVTPSAINLVQHGYAGAALQVPLSIGALALFVQARGNIIRDLQYSIYTTTYTGKDTTLYAPQLFENRTIVQMDWQQIYNSIIWCVQDNGTLLGLTYLKDQDLLAWHRHDTTGGFVEQACVVPEGTADVLYLVVRRTLNGATVRYIERVTKREFSDSVMLSDAIFTDCSLTYDGRNTGATTVLPTTGAGWTPQDTITLHASASIFVAGDVGNAIVFQQLDSASGLVTDSVTYAIIGYTSGTTVSALPSKTVPLWAQATTTSWGKAVHNFSGFGALEAQAISAQGDGAVALNALTDLVPTVVSGGAFTTANNYLVLTAGLPITAQWQTLPWEGGGKTETMGNKQQLIVEMTAYLYNTRGGTFGQDFAHLNTWKQRGLLNEPMSSPPALYTGPAIIPIQGTWQATGQVCAEQLDPLPMAVSAVIATGFEGS